jgi:hypothetical protein
MKTLVLTSLFAFSAVEANAAAVSYVIASASGEQFGTSKTVTGSGSDTNYVGATVGNYTTFSLALASNPTVPVIDLRVGYASGNAARIMLVQTQDSQGFTDAGTISILLNTNGAGSTGGPDLSANLSFDFFQHGTTNPFTGQFQFTTFDIDSNQSVVAGAGQFQNYQLDADSDLTGTVNPDGSVTVADLLGVSSSFTEASSAASFLSNNVNHVDFTVTSASNVGLYAFELRTPSANVVLDGPTNTVPEPTFASLGLAAGMILLRRRRA